MTQAKFTPGPWYYEPAETEPYYNVESERWVVARVWADVEELNSPANAVLIAAAPDMHDALEAMVKWAENVNEFSNEGGLLGDAYDSAIEALKKAGRP